MRKTSQDGGDSTSITSGIENEIKKPGAKTKRNSIKRKVPNFSLESDDAVIEPLLQKDKEKPDTTKPSAKFNLMSKTKTEVTSERVIDKNKLISDVKSQRAVVSNASDVTDKIVPTSNAKENSMSQLKSTNAPLHNHMNTNVFSNHDGLKTFVAPKSQILVEIDGSKHVGYNPSPLIFTTAKIHTDGKTKHMEPVQMTPVPILSTIEVSVMKGGINTGESSGHVTSNISAVYIPQSNNSIMEQDPKLTFKTANNSSTPQNKVADTKIQMLTDKTLIKSNTFDKTSVALTLKETKSTQPSFPSTSVEDNTTENKIMNKENNTKKEEYHLKTTTQPNSSTSDKNKTIFPHDAKSGAASVAPTKTSKDKTKDTTNTSFSSKQLQRENIVLDKDDPISKSKPNTVSVSVTNDSKGFNKSGESQKPSTIEINTLNDKTILPKSSTNSIPITSVTSVSTNTSVTDNKQYASITTAAVNKKPSSITGTAAAYQTGASAINSATNNPPVAANTSVANKTSFPIISSTNKTFDSTTATNSNVKTTSEATKKVSAPITAAADISKKSAPITTAAAVNKNSVPISTSTVVNKTPAPISNIVGPNKISALSTATTAGSKMTIPTTSIADGNKAPSTSATATTGNKISTATTPITASSMTYNPSKTAATNRISTTSTTISAGNKISTSLPATTSGNKISAPSAATIVGNKSSNTITTTAVTNKTSTPSTTTTITTGNKAAPSRTTIADSKISAPSTTTMAGNKISSQSTSFAAGNKIPSASTTNNTTGNKNTVPSSTTTAGNKISAPSTNATVATNKIPGPVINTTTSKITTDSKTATTGREKSSTSNSNSSGKPITSLSSDLTKLSDTPKAKSAIVTTSSALKPLNTEKYSSNPSAFGSIKSGIANETAANKPQGTNTLNSKPTTLPTTSKPAKVTTVATPTTTTSQRTMVVKSPTATTAKSASTKTVPQPAKGKLTEITPKKLTSNEKPSTSKSTSTSISSTTTSGMSNVTSTASASSSTLTSSGSSSVSAGANKQSDSKSKVISNGSKGYKA